MVNTASKISFSRRILFLGIVVVITITTSIIFFANVEAREYFSHWIISIVHPRRPFAFLIIFQQKQYHGLIEKADLALVIALGLSLGAETLWAIYEYTGRHATGSVIGRCIISIRLCFIGILCFFNISKISQAISF